MYAYVDKESNTSADFLGLCYPFIQLVSKIISASGDEAAFPEFCNK